MVVGITGEDRERFVASIPELERNAARLREEHEKKA